MTSDRMFYPVECVHGFGCCPKCDRDALRHDREARTAEAQERAERYADPFEQPDSGEAS